MGGCQKVIETTKAFGQLKDFHMLESMGIVDRDRRTEGEIRYLNEQHICSQCGRGRKFADAGRRHQIGCRPVDEESG